LQSLFVWLALLGLLLQAVTAGLPAGQAICIGCERGEDGWGWTVSEPCPPSIDGCCCDDEGPDRTTPVFASAEFTTDGCGCVDLPLIGGPIAAVLTSARGAGSFETEFVAAAAPGAVSAHVALAGATPKAAARARPVWGHHPPRLLAPMARRTILIV
jgi:hypothetical protein